MKPVGWFFLSMIALVAAVLIYDIKKDAKDGYK